MRITPVLTVFFCQAEDGIRDLVRSRGLVDVYKRQIYVKCEFFNPASSVKDRLAIAIIEDAERSGALKPCLLYTSDAADELLCVDLGGRRILKKKNHTHTNFAYASSHLCAGTSPTNYYPSVHSHTN